MNCVEKGTLRAKLDGELTGRELEEVERHLSACADCRRELAEMAAVAAGVRRVLEPLGPLPGEGGGDPVAALAHLRARAASEGAEAERGAFSQVWARRWAPAWGVALALCALAVAMAFAPARSWAQRVLALLRVEKIEVVAVNPVLPGPGTGDRTAKMVQQLITDNLVVTQDPGKPRGVATVAEASSLAGFPARALTGRADAPQVSVEGEQAFHFTLNRSRLQAIVDEAGRSDIQLPASIDGAEVAVHIPKAVVMRYGDLPEEGALNGGDASEGAAAKAQNFLVFAQVPAPAVSVPPNLNIAQVAEAGLELGGMSPAAAQSFVSSVDWTSTLVIPVPVEGALTEKMPVDGVEGTLITAPPEGRRPAGYTLIWIKNGIVYSLSGAGDASAAQALADSLN
ncbi:MAG TPA: zf-HC2 domain-containing protein [Terriglobia bacterium]|nr:zf-HC2 domain-containing protein [Terriglobia bacterium]